MTATIIPIAPRLANKTPFRPGETVLLRPPVPFEEASYWFQYDSGGATHRVQLSSRMFTVPWNYTGGGELIGIYDDVEIPDDVSIEFEYMRDGEVIDD